MAVIRNTASALARGRIGNTTYYVANGQQVARQSKNNSNYGDQASRTESQQVRRVKWSNLVNFYKACMFWMPKAFENKKRNQSDYNRFMQVNIGSTSVALTKDMAANGCSVVEPFVVSQGSLQPIELQAGPASLGWYTDIEISAAITAQTTIADLSADIIAKNPEWQNGDNLAMVQFRNVLDSRGYPYVSTLYYEFTLDTTNENLFKSTGDGAYFFSEQLSTKYYIGTGADWAVQNNSVGVVFIHTRKVGGQLMTSSQAITVDDGEYISQFSTQAAIDAAVASYGVNEEVPLDPSFKLATITSVAVNGSVNPLINGRIVTYNQPVTLVISGDNMTSDNVWLEHDGTRYTPLDVDGNSWTYILGDNGTNKIFVNGVLYGGVAIRDIVVPSVLPTNLRMSQASDIGAGPTTANTYAVNGNCNNYARVATEEYPCFQLFINGGSVEEFPEEDFAGSNCTIKWYSSAGGVSVKVGAEPTDATKPCYIMFQGFIIAVFNYTE